jgi:hypothetical protein
MMEPLSICLLSTRLMRIIWGRRHPKITPHVASNPAVYINTDIPRLPITVEFLITRLNVSQFRISIREDILMNFGNRSTPPKEKLRHSLRVFWSARKMSTVYFPCFMTFAAFCYCTDAARTGVLMLYSSIMSTIIVTGAMSDTSGFSNGYLFISVTDTCRTNTGFRVRVITGVLCSCLTIRSIVSRPRSIIQSRVTKRGVAFDLSFEPCQPLFKVLQFFSQTSNMEPHVVTHRSRDIGGVAL